MINQLQFSTASQVKTEPKVNRPAVQGVSAAGPVRSVADRFAQVREGTGGAPPPESVSAEVVDKMAQDVADRLQTNQRQLQFSVDSETNSTVVRVIDSETKELIRQIPSEELLAISRRLEAATGLLVDDKV
jgi:flagellar protein FlaG